MLSSHQHDDVDGSRFDRNASHFAGQLGSRVSLYKASEVLVSLTIIVA
jgi:hypothetical protein